MERTDETRPAVLGRLTYTDMTCMEDLFRDREPDAWGRLRTPFSPRVARLSAELTADAYAVDVKGWDAAGWDDCTFIVEDKVIALGREGDSYLATMESEWRLRRARSMIRGVNPLGDLMRAIRQLMVTDMGKAIVMTRALPDGRAVVAISFIGTTQKYYDWFSNFKFKQDGGMHHGFAALARGFDAQTPRILLPRLAVALGEETLTLADVLIEAQQPGSRFALWISGHSQGGAIAQTYTHLLMARGVPGDCIHGYTFAAPTVAMAGGSLDPAAYPIYNIVNTDDIVPRLGARVRLGMDWVYHPDDAFRHRHYRVDKDDWPAFSKALFTASRVQTTDEALCWGISMIRLMREVEGDEELATLFAAFMPQMKLLKRVNLAPEEVARFLEEKLLAQYQGFAGHEPDEDLCGVYEADIRGVLIEYGAKSLAKALLAALEGPHRMRPDKHDEAYVPTYIAIVRRHLGECLQGVWTAQGEPRCLTARGEPLLPMAIHRPLSLPGPAARPTLPAGGTGNKPDGSAVWMDREPPADPPRQTDDSGGENL